MCYSNRNHWNFLHDVVKYQLISSIKTFAWWVFFSFPPFCGWFSHIRRQDEDETYVRNHFIYKLTENGQDGFQFFWCSIFSLSWLGDAICWTAEKKTFPRNIQNAEIFDSISFFFSCWNWSWVEIWLLLVKKTPRFFRWEQWYLDSYLSRVISVQNIQFKVNLSKMAIKLMF